MFKYSLIGSFESELFRLEMFNVRRSHSSWRHRKPFGTPTQENLQVLLQSKESSREQLLPFRRCAQSLLIACSFYEAFDAIWDYDVSGLHPSYNQLTQKHRNARVRHASKRTIQLLNPRDQRAEPYPSLARQASTTWPRRVSPAGPNHNGQATV